MEGRKHTGVILTTLSLKDASEARAWEEKWRNQSSATGVAFRLSPGYDFGGVTHFIIDETDQEDVAAAVARVDISGGTTVSYTKIADYGPISDGRTAGVVLVLTDCEEPAEEDAFNEWYSGHLHHTVDSIDFYAATRYVSNNPSQTPSKYFAIYESQSDDPAKVQKDGVDWWVKGGFEGPKGRVLRYEIPGERID